jgi:hypothetical protein
LGDSDEAQFTKFQRSHHVRFGSKADSVWVMSAFPQADIRWHWMECLLWAKSGQSEALG